MSRAVKFDQYGDRSVLYIAEVEVPSPSADEVVVRVRGCHQSGRSVHPSRGAREGVSGHVPVGRGQRLGWGRQCGWPGGDRVRRRWTGFAAVAALQSRRVRRGPRHTVDQEALDLSWEVAGSLYVVRPHRDAGRPGRGTSPGRNSGGLRSRRRSRHGRRATVATEGRDWSSASPRSPTTTGSAVGSSRWRTVRGSPSAWRPLPQTRSTPSSTSSAPNTSSSPSCSGFRPGGSRRSSLETRHWGSGARWKEAETPRPLRFFRRWPISWPPGRS